jgi:hypothetical protein
VTPPCSKARTESAGSVERAGRARGWSGYVASGAVSHFPRHIIGSRRRATREPALSNLWSAPTFNTARASRRSALRGNGSRYNPNNEPPFVYCWMAGVSCVEGKLSPTSTTCSPRGTPPPLEVCKAQPPQEAALPAEPMYQSKRWDTQDYLKYGALVVLVVQNSALALTMRYSRTVAGAMYIAR